MADSEDTPIEDSAEKAYAAAAEAIADKETTDSETAAVAVEFPPRAKRGRKPRTETIDAAAKAPEPALEDSLAEAPADEDLPVSTDVSVADAKHAAKAKKTSLKLRAPRAKPTRLAVKRAAAKSAPSQTKIRQPAVVIAPSPVKAPAAAKATVVPKISAKPARKPSLKTVKPVKPPVTKPPLIAKLKEIPMDMTDSFKDAVTGAQEKAKEAFTKSSAFAGEYGEFAKGNVEAIVESSKILAAGLQEMGSQLVADSKTAFETMTSDVKGLKSVKSPTDLLKFQTDLLRRNFDTAFAQTSKTGEALIKLTGDVIAPLSSRVSLAVEKVRKAA